MIAYLVCGPESSGTRLLTQAIVMAGVWGDYGHEQRLDGPPLNRDNLVLPEQLPERLVLRRSFPHGKDAEGTPLWPNILKLTGQLRDAGYQIMVLQMYRDTHCMQLSQLRWKHTESAEQAGKQINRAIQTITQEFAWLGLLPTIIVYESLLCCAYRQLLFKRLGLTWPHDLKIFDGDARYKIDSVEDESCKDTITKT